MPVEEKTNYFRVRQRPPSQFTQFRTPTWAAKVASATSRGSKVVVGRTTKGEWKVQSVIIRKRKGVGKTRAVALAKKIRCKIEKECASRV